MDELMIKVLKTIKKCKIYWNNRSPALEFDITNLPGGKILSSFENLPRGCPGEGMVTLEIGWYISNSLLSFQTFNEVYAN